MRLPGLKTMRRTADWLYSRAANFVLILGYHRVAETAVDPYNLCVRPDHFAGQMAVLRCRADVIDLPTLADRLQKRRLPRRAVSITFDDGYQDIWNTARPLLAVHDLPATVFVVAGALGQEFWWDRLARIIFRPAVLPDSLTLTIGAETFTWSLLDAVHMTLRKEADTPRLRLLFQLYARLMERPAERPFLLDALEEWAETTQPAPAATARVITAVELQGLSGDGLFTVGSHTITHPHLVTISRQQQCLELTSSRKTLEHILERPVTTFSYPHGSGNAQTRQLLQETGFQLACTSRNGLVYQGSDHLALPRFWVPDWDEEQFGRFLNRWLGS